MMSNSFERFKLHPRMIHILVPFFLSFSMSCIVSFVSTIMSVGFANFQLGEWFSAWMFSWFIAFPSVLTILPIVRKFAKFFIRESP